MRNVNEAERGQSHIPHLHTFPSIGFPHPLVTGMTLITKCPPFLHSIVTSGMRCDLTHTPMSEAQGVERPLWNPRGPAPGQECSAVPFSVHRQGGWEGPTLFYRRLCSGTDQ